MIKGQLPFEDVRLNNYDAILKVGRPILPNDVNEALDEETFK